MFPDYFILYRPKDIVSGDFYWINERNNKFYLVAADCTGHGVTGAFMSMLGITYLNEMVNSPYNKNGGIQANEILNILREKIKRSLKQNSKEEGTKDGMDLALCIFDFETNIMQFAGANNPVFIFRWNT